MLIKKFWELGVVVVKLEKYKEIKIINKYFTVLAEGTIEKKEVWKNPNPFWCDCWCQHEWMEEEEKYFFYYSSIHKAICKKILNKIAVKW